MIIIVISVSPSSFLEKKLETSSISMNISQVKSNRKIICMILPWYGCAVEVSKEDSYYH